MLTLPGDAVRQIQWRFADRFDFQMLVQSARGVARGTVARLVAAGERNTHEWTPGKAGMLEAFDRAGITAAFMEPEEGGFIAGPKNLALSGRLMNSPGSTAARPPPAWPASSPFRPSTSAALRSRSPATRPSLHRRNPVRTANPGAAHSPLPSPSPTSASIPAC
jgi:hypothetical protein